jgi:DNA-binding beta-propeller fold protein YncE
MIVGTAVPTLTYTLTGFKNNQTSSVVLGTPAFQALGLNLTEGTYPIVINKGTLSATNYEFQLIDGLLTVNKDTATPIVSATDSTIKIYPNPAKDFVMVENAENDVISIIDFSGKEVYSTKVLNSAARIDVSKLNQGVYILKVNNNHQNYAKTLLINR